MKKPITHRDKMQLILLFILVGIFTLITLGVVYLQFIDANPPVEVTTPAEVDKETYAPGGTVIMLAEVCRNTEVPAEIYRAFLNTDTDDLVPIIPNPIRTATLGLGCKIVVLPVDIPPDIPLGRYVLDFTGAYKVNFLATRIANWHTESFIICTGGNCDDFNTCEGHDCPEDETNE
jgi:hypothetical protein